MLLAVTNTFEGTTFTLPTKTNVTDFVRQLFPTFSVQQINKAVSYYTALNATLPEALDQSIAVMGECLYVSSPLDVPSHFKIITANFICPTYSLLKAFNGKSWKVSISIYDAIYQ